MIKLIIAKKKKKCSGLGEDATVSNEPFQKHLRKVHPKHKKRLIGLGKGKTAAGGSPYKIKVPMKRSKSAPPAG